MPADTFICCPIYGEHGFFPESKIFDDRDGKPHRYTRARYNNRQCLAAAPRLHELELTALCASSDHCKMLVADPIESDAYRVKPPVGGISRCWSGTDNRGQCEVRAEQHTLEAGCRSVAAPNMRPIAAKPNPEICIKSVDDRRLTGSRFELVVMNQVIGQLPEAADSPKPLRDLLTVESLRSVS